MRTQVLLSSVTTLPLLEPAFRIAKELGFHGLEVMPYRWTDPRKVNQLALGYQIPVLGVHLPFWWRSKSFSRVIAAETSVLEKGFACLWNCLFGPGHPTCPAVRLIDSFPDAYCLIHPDTFLQAKQEIFNACNLQNRQVMFENERPKKGEPDLAFNPFEISEYLLPSFPKKGKLMFDPGHVQIATANNHFRLTAMYRWYGRLWPEGLHLSFSGEGRLHDLPNEKEWEDLVNAIRNHPPEVLVVETRPGPGAYKRIKAAREMIRRDLGL